MKKTIGFIGCGNMGGAIAKAVFKSSDFNIILSDHSREKAEGLAKEINAIVTDNSEATKSSDYIFLGVKPQALKEVISTIKNDLKPRENVAIISMAAGVCINTIEEYFGYHIPIIRIMPNIPVSVGEGMILYCYNDKVTQDNLKDFSDAMSHAGTLDSIPEGLIDAGSAVSGCGPAFASMFIQALADGGVAVGLPRDKALLYAIKTLKGSATLINDAKIHPEQLKDAVCSPSGSTIEGVKALENGALRATIMNAISSSYKRTVELGKKS